MLRPALLFALLCAPAAAFADDPSADPPNIILMIADDLGDGDLGCQGHPHARTPNIDRLASEGMQFTNAVLTISSCSPSRASILTGQYPHETDAEQLHWALPGRNETFSERLKAAGYFTASAGKWHLGGEVRDRFDLVVPGRGQKYTMSGGPNGEPVELTASKSPSACGDWVPVLKNRPKDEPFFFWFAAIDPHRGYQKGTIPQPHTGDDAVVPPFIPDTPTVRDDFADYMDEVTRLDGYVGDVLAELERQGVADNTLVLFISDNGRPFPRCKTTLYDSGIKTPLIARLPGVTPPGSTCDRLVSVVDISATILDMASAGPLKHGRGESFAALLSDPNGPVIRDYAFSEKNWHDYDASQRSVRTTRWKYIRNLAPELPDTPPADAVNSPTFKEMKRLRDAGELTAEQAEIFTPGPEEQLYDLSADPDELNNLADDPAHAATLNELRTVLDRWRTETADPTPPVRSADEFDRETGRRLPDAPKRTTKAAMFP